MVSRYDDTGHNIGFNGECLKMRAGSVAAIAALHFVLFQLAAFVAYGDVSARQQLGLTAPALSETCKLIVDTIAVPVGLVSPLAYLWKGFDASALMAGLLNSLLWGAMVGVLFFRKRDAG